MLQENLRQRTMQESVRISSAARTLVAPVATVLEECQRPLSVLVVQAVRSPSEVVRLKAQSLLQRILDAADCLDEARHSAAPEIAADSHVVDVELSLKQAMGTLHSIIAQTPPLVRSAEEV